MPKQMTVNDLRYSIQNLPGTAILMMGDKEGGYREVSFVSGGDDGRFGRVLYLELGGFLRPFGSVATKEKTVDHLTEEQKERFNDMKALFETGDLDVDGIKSDFKKNFERYPSLTEDQILECFASQDDDYGDADIVARMKALEDGESLNWEGVQGEEEAAEVVGD